MKKIYEQPKLAFSAIDTIDILTASSISFIDEASDCQDVKLFSFFLDI